jgi:hypothetical protein
MSRWDIAHDYPGQHSETLRNALRDSSNRHSPGPHGREESEAVAGWGMLQVCAQHPAGLKMTKQPVHLRYRPCSERTIRTMVREMDARAMVKRGRRGVLLGGGARGDVVGVDERVLMVPQ